MKRIHLDHNATAPLNPEVSEVMLPYYKDLLAIFRLIQKAKEEAEG